MIDTGFLKDWTLVQVEGETPGAEDSQELSGSPSKGMPAGWKASGQPANKKKPEPKKGAKNTAALEEITDNRPRFIAYEYDVVEANNGVGLEVTEDIAIKFASAKLNLAIYEVDRESPDNEMLRETISIDLSSMLFEQNNIDVSQINGYKRISKLYFIL